MFFEIFAFMLAAWAIFLPCCGPFYLFTASFTWLENMICCSLRDLTSYAAKFAFFLSRLAMQTKNFRGST